LTGPGVSLHNDVFLKCNLICLILLGYDTDCYRLATETQKQIKLSDKFEDLTLGSNRPTAVVEQYGSLYSEIRLDTLDSLDAFPQLADLDNLKNKLLFSVIVVSWLSISFYVIC